MATGLAILVALNPVAGLQLYADPPLALSCVLIPSQIATSDPALAAGSGETVIVILEVFVHPELFVPVTV